MYSNALITADAWGNAAASDLQIRFSDLLSLDHSQIKTSAVSGDGGAIRLTGGRVIHLADSRITTSVSGANGNGGDISVAADALVMNTGFIQANTAARDASGGNVEIRVDALLPSARSLMAGGATPYAYDQAAFGFNVIQAAAPTGLSGNVAITAPTLDLSGALAGVSARVADAVALGRSPCHGTAGSSLAVLGQSGVLPARAGGGRKAATDVRRECLP